MVIQILDDLSDIDKNVWMNGVNNPEDLYDKPDRVQEFDTEKVENAEKAWGKIEILMTCSYFLFRNFTAE